MIIASARGVGVGKLIIAALWLVISRRRFWIGHGFVVERVKDVNVNKGESRQKGVTHGE